MIETIKTYTAATRMEGRLSMTVGRAYRCTLCGKIKLVRKELDKHDCKTKDQK
jgi:hypothetical protein